MSFLYKGFPLANADMLRYLDPPTGSFGLIDDLVVSSFGEDILVRKSYRDTYPYGKGVQKVDYGSL